MLLYTLQTHLHSNMFLLFRGTYEVNPWLIAKFTFQYVSIISRADGLIKATYAMYLHSNMFLLFRCVLHNMCLLHLHLHSNTFLLFRGIGGSPSCEEPYLHSNMFLLFQKVVGVD